ncbi:MAG TPA: PhoH family protein [Acidimicrobiales bacterium]|nr:PhoH family protein [Acidimicrobiales bacterium]
MIEPAVLASARARRTYVLDTSVLLADPRSLQRFDEHDVVIPIVVLIELEAKRNHPELGWAARQTLRLLEDHRTQAGSLTEPLVVNRAGGTLRVELNHQDTAGLPAALESDNNDHRILAVAKNLADEGHEVTVVTKDLPLRLKSSIVGLDADEYRNELATGDPSWSGFAEIEVDSDSIDELFAERVVDLVEARELPCNTGVALVAGLSGSQSALGRVHDDKRVHLVRGDRTLFDLHGRSAEQRIAIDLLADPRVGIVSIGGPAGTGKSVIALAAGLESVLEQRTHKRVVVFRPIYAVGGQDLGFLPGTEAEKMSPWSAAVTDALESIVGPEVIDEVVSRKLLEVLPLTHIRGRSLNDSFVILDEAQNLEKPVLLTALSRLGEGSRVVLTHDVAQRDNLRVGRHDGIASVIDALRGHPLFGHITLTRSERSAIAALVTQLLDGSA